MSRRPWTPIEVQVLREFVRSSDIGDIARALGRPRKRVLEKARDLLLPVRGQGRRIPRMWEFN